MMSPLRLRLFRTGRTHRRCGSSRRRTLINGGVALLDRTRRSHRRSHEDRGLHAHLCSAARAARDHGGPGTGTALSTTMVARAQNAARSVATLTATNGIDAVKPAGGFLVMAKVDGCEDSRGLAMDRHRKRARRHHPGRFRRTWRGLPAALVRARPRSTACRRPAPSGAVVGTDPR